MLLAMSAWMRLMLGEVETAVPALAQSVASPLPGALPPERERIRCALHAAVTAHPLHRELVQVHGLGGCQYFAFAGAMALESLGLGRAEVALGRVAFRAGRPGGRPRWVGYPAARADVRVPDPTQEREEAEAFPFHAWIRLTGPDGRTAVVDFDLSNVLREVRLRAPGERFDLHPVATVAFWGSAMEARAAGLRFEVQRRLTADALLPGDRSVFEDIADDACARLRP